MRRPHVVSVAATLLLVISASACGVEESMPESAAGEPPPEATGNPAPEPEHHDLDPNNFGRSTVIDNEWYPLQPGTRWIFEGYTTEDEEEIPHRIEFTVTDLTKEIQGVRTVVAWIKDYSDGELIEAEIAFYAQDNDGNVWYLGEYAEEYEEGRFVKAPTWIAGLQDARAGIKMWAEPNVGMPSYFQGGVPRSTGRTTAR